MIRRRDGRGTGFAPDLPRAGEVHLSGHQGSEHSVHAARPEESGTPTPGSPLRVGILVDSFAQPRWAAKLVADLQAAPFASLVLVVRHVADPAPREGLLRRMWRHRGSLLHDAYVRLDRRLFQEQPDAFAREDIQPFLRDCTAIDATSREEDLARIRAHGLDVLVVLAADARPGAFATAARHGAWALRHAADPRDGEAVAGLWEVLEADRTTGSLLEVWSPGSPASHAIYRSYGPTDHISVRRNRNPLYWKSAAFVLRKLRDLAAEGPLALREVPAGPATAARPLRGVPGNLAMAGLLFRLALRYARKKLLDLLTREQWYLAYRFEAAPADGFLGLVRVMPPKDRYWADPCPVEAEDGRRFVFFEELRFDSAKATIRVIEIDPGRGAGKPVPVLERPYHLSYPQVFRWQGQYYMVPESSENRTVTLFRCVSFPDRWIEERDLLKEIDAVDPTLAEVNGRWWLFANVAPYGAGNRDELHLFHAPSPLGPFTPHAKNPVKSDCRSARPAGPLFRREGVLYRPAQNCAGGYGTSIVLHRIDLLTPEEYHETQVEEIVPTWDPEARRAHTLAHGDGLLVIDLMRRQRRFF